MIKSESIVNLVNALLKAKEKFTPIIKERENPGFKRNGKFSKYEDLAAVIDATDPSLAEQGLVIIQFPQSDADRVGVLTILLHTSGEYWGDSFTLPLATPNAQTGVGAITYARRAALKSVLGVAAEDDDGNTASGRAPEQSQSSDDMPDFRDAQHPAPRPAAAPKTEKPTPTPAPVPQQATLGVAVDAPSTATITPSATPAVAPSTPEAAPTADKGVAPPETELAVYRSKFSKLGDDLSTLGKLKASKSLPLNRKLLIFLLKITEAPTAQDITKAQWDDFFSRVEHVKGLDNGWVGLAKLVNKANGIEEKTK